MNKYAHSANSTGGWHLLEDHLKQVGKLAAQFAKKIDAPDLAYLVGRWHDLGKYHIDFYTKRLCGGTDSFDHTAAGTIFACEHRLIIRAALAIYGHHIGLPNLIDFKHKICSASEAEFVTTVLKSFTVDRNNKSVAKWSDTGTEKSTEVELFVRLLFSCLVDADFLDTEAHFDNIKSGYRKTSCDFADLYKRLIAVIEGKPKHGELNTIRNEIFQTCVAKASLPPDVYKLSVPTGAGKTLSSMAFAIKHLMTNELDRIILVIPYLSIIDQTAKIFKDVFGDRHVIEHHSSVANNTSFAARLAAENWDAPIVITTAVQFFESLFSNRPSKCRKLHNILNSIVIFDEIQFLPAKYLLPITDVLYQLKNSYNCSLLLSTATQPGYQFSELNEGVEIVEKDYTSLSDRVEYVNIGKKSIDEVAEMLKTIHQALVVFNVKKDALKLAKMLNCFHLSTNMCGAHRRDVLKEIRDKLSKDERCILSATQVIEAGVDIDFPVGFRAIGPLDRIIQTGGRVNREGKLEKGVLYIFDNSSIFPPGEYESASRITKKLLNHNDVTTIEPEKYFNELWKYCELDGKQINKERRNLNFEKVAQTFKMIDDDTIPIVIDYKGLATKSIEDLEERVSRINIRKLQPFMLNVRARVFRGVEKHLEEIGSSGIFKLDSTQYDEYGIVRR